jgi:hypothetical protein
MVVDLQARLLAKACLLAMCAGCFFGHAHAASLVWTERTNGDLTTLAYGSLDPDEIPLLLLSCFNEMEIAVLDVHQAVEGSAGDTITIEISSAKGQAPIEGEIAKNRETGTTFAEASDIKVKPILEVLRDEGQLTLSLGDASATLSDSGRAAAVAQFTKDCRLN